MSSLLAPHLEVHTQLVNQGAEADLNHALDLLAEVKAGRRDAMLRLYRPEPTVAFGQRDTRLPGFAAAEQASRTNGFVPAVRRAGGRAAAYHRGTLIVDHWDPSTAGAAEDLLPGLTVEDVEAAILEAYTQHTQLSGA